MATASASSFFPITPDDDNDLSPHARGILIGTDGTLRITDGDGEVRNLPEGLLATNYIHPIIVQRVHDTGTTATNIWGAE